MHEERRTFISLKWLIAVSVMGLLTLLTLGIGKIIVGKEAQVLEEETERRLLAQARNVAALSASPLLDEYPEFVLHPIIKDLLDENPELAYAVVVDRNGIIRGDRNLTRVDQPYEDSSSLRDRLVGIARSPEEVFRQNEEIVEVSIPVVYRDGSVLGKIFLGIQKEYMNRLIRAAERSTVRVLMVALAAGLILTVLLVSNITRPINELTKGTEEIGKGNLDYKIHVKSRTEVGRLAGTFNEMTTRLRNAQKELVEKERLNREIEIAHEIEEKLLPRPNLELPGYEVAGFHQSAQKVGGDYYDLIPMDEERVGITVADVAGKGIPGLVVMAMTSALLRSHAPRFRSPAEMLTELNEMLYPNMRRGMFITMFYGILHLPTGRFTFAGAGHNPLIHFRRHSGLQSLLGTTGVPLGLYPDERFAERIRDQKIRLEEGDGFVQYTDGVNEAVNEEMEEFGIDSLLEIAKRECGRGAKELVNAVVSDVRSFTAGVPQSDDITLFAVRRLPRKKTTVAEALGTA